MKSRSTNLTRRIAILTAVMTCLAASWGNAQPVAMDRPDIGVGLEGLADWSRAKMFSDVMKTSRQWGKPDQPWVNEVKTDAFGWPTEDAGVVCIADTPNIGGTYKLSFDGKADVSATACNATIQNAKYDIEKKITTADIVIPSDGTSLMLSFRNTNEGVKNVKLLRPGADPRSTFYAPFLKKLKPFSTLRFMDYLATNGNPSKKWEERTTPAFASQARPQGGGLEYVVQLANESGKDIWINVPDQVDDDYVRKMATLLKNGLNPQRKVYVEFSNEVWNWGFAQATRNLDAAKVEGRLPNSPLNYDGTDNEGYWAMRRIALRAVQTGQIFQNVFGDKTFARVRPVYAVQVGWEEVYKQGLDFLEHQYKTPSTVIYGIAGAPYFNLNDEENKRGDITTEEILNVLPQRIDETLESGAKLSAYAHFYGLKMLAYEGGPHLHDPGGNGSSDAKVAANRDPRMGALVEKYLRGWNSIGGDTFLYFTLSGGFGKWGSWGLVEDIEKSGPKYEAAVKVADAPEAPLTFGALLGTEIKAGDFYGSNRWDQRGIAEVTIEPDKWMQYVVRAEKAGIYTLAFALSAGQEAKTEIEVNEKTSEVFDVSAASTHIEIKIPLTSGLNVLRVKGVTGKWQLKSLKIQ